MATILEQYRISDFIEWDKENKLIINSDFQRGSVWSPAARTYLIDTILRDLPIPKIYLRTRVDVDTKQSLREIVDGQQRLRAILDFAKDKLILSKRSNEFSGLKYSSLSAEFQEVFLSYPLSVDQLLNASDDDVLEVFSRLNSYSVQLNPPEKRHARYQGEFKWAIKNSSKKWSILWDRYRIISVSSRVRMMDDSLIAEMYGILLDGVKDGGQEKINRLYQRYDSVFSDDDPVIDKLDNILEFFVENIAEAIKDTPLMNSTHFLMLFAGISHALNGIPDGDLAGEMPTRENVVLGNIPEILDNLMNLASVIDEDELPPTLEEFWKASKSTTQRISSRKIRFNAYYKSMIQHM